MEEPELLVEDIRTFFRGPPRLTSRSSARDRARVESMIEVSQ